MFGGSYHFVEVPFVMSVFSKLNILHGEKMLYAKSGRDKGGGFCSCCLRERLFPTGCLILGRCPNRKISWLSPILFFSGSKSLFQMINH